MSHAEILKHLKIKASSVKRIQKELSMYAKERVEEQSKVDAMKSHGADATDIKFAENVLAESAMMLPQTRQRLEAAYADLQAYLAENAEEVKDSEELKTAKEILDEVAPLFA